MTICQLCDVATCSRACLPLLYRYVGRAPEYRHQRGRRCCVLSTSITAAMDGWCQVRFEDGEVSVRIPRGAVRRLDSRCDAQS